MASGPDFFAGLDEFLPINSVYVIHDLIMSVLHLPFYVSSDIARWLFFIELLPVDSTEYASLRNEMLFISLIKQCSNPNLFLGQ